MTATMYRRPFADTAPVNRPATPDATLSPTARASALAAFANNGPLRLRTKKYGVPVYYASQATTSARLVIFAWAAKFFSFKIGTAVPWNLAWMPPAGSGNDRTIIIIDDREKSKTLNRVWELWMVGDENGGLGDAVLHFPNYWSAFWKPGLNVAVAQISVYDNLYTRDDRKFLGLRGSKLEKLACLVRLQELQAGIIRHAINMTVRTRVTTKFASPARDAEIKTLADGQRGGVITKVWDDDHSMISGQSYVLLWTDSQIAAHVDRIMEKYGYSGEKIRQTGIAFLTAFATYAAIATETGGEYSGDIGIETDWCEANAADYRELGIWPNGDTGCIIDFIIDEIPLAAWAPAAPR